MSEPSLAMTFKHNLEVANVEDICFSGVSCSQLMVYSLSQDNDMKAESIELALKAISKVRVLGGADTPFVPFFHA